MKLPLKFDKTPNGRIVECAKLGEEGYTENVMYQFHFGIVDGEIQIWYEGEDGNEINMEDNIEEFEFIIQNYNVL